MNERVSDTERDEIMEIILSYPENNKCFDCGSKNPVWASTYLGIVICFECAGKHRSFGTHISFVRSVNLDKWNRKQLKSMELAGNQYARLKFNDLGVPKDNGVYDYFNDQVLKYKSELAERVASSLGSVGMVSSDFGEARAGIGEVGVVLVGVITDRAIVRGREVGCLKHAAGAE